MAYIEIRYCCPICKAAHSEYIEAVRCRNKHDIIVERWAVGKHKKVRIFENHHKDSCNGENGALKEADLSDNIHERRKQLEELRKINGG
jgi:hypothetical protein